MELFEEIRRGYAAGETIQGLAKKHGCTPDGAPGDRQCDPAGTEEAPTTATETRSIEGSHRPDSGRRPAGTAEAAAHGASHLDTAAPRAPGARGPPPTHAVRSNRGRQTGARMWRGTGADKRILRQIIGRRCTENASNICSQTSGPWSENCAKTHPRAIWPNSQSRAERVPGRCRNDHPAPHNGWRAPLCALGVEGQASPGAVPRIHSHTH